MEGVNFQAANGVLEEQCAESEVCVRNDACVSVTFDDGPLNGHIMQEAELWVSPLESGGEVVEVEIHY